MSELLPTRQAEQIQSGLLDYLTTTFALAEPNARQALTDFLSDPESGIFKGPYLRLRLPFAPATPGWENLLSWELPHTPYRHQAEAFERLVSNTPTGEARRPQPTLVTTGTGSGKTEAFLFPILDHVLRSRRMGQEGIKALILYPMNALANDQAMRLAELITSRPELAGITAGLYTGQKDKVSTVVTADGLITDRAVIRDNPPDILLTNYKMLDQLLLRHEDARLWERSSNSLQYLVLDEFHTYDGAQGTDVAMLLRRLGITLKSYWPTNDADLPEHGLTPEDRARPLGRVTPIATSATLGDDGDPQAMINFATTIFGEEFDPTMVIGESRLTYTDWTNNRRPLPDTFEAVDLNRIDIAALLSELDDARDGAELAHTFFAAAFNTRPETIAAHHADGSVSLLDLVKTHPVTRDLTELTSNAESLDELNQRLFAAEQRNPGYGPRLLIHTVSVLSHVRATSGRDALSVDLHMWLRELSRIDRVAAASAKYLWSDDGGIVLGESDPFSAHGHPAFPAVYCRHCGRSGWGVELAPIGDDLHTQDINIRRNHAGRKGRFRALLLAEGEADHAVFKERNDDSQAEGLVWFHIRQRTLLTEPPHDDDPDFRDGWVLPVLTQIGQEADDRSQRDDCPSCGQRDGIRFLGSAIATMLSVTLSTLFGDDQLDAGEKKALVFTDSVQDAAHRAGFVEARSHTLTLRAAIRAAIKDTPLSLDELVTEVLREAGDDPFRRYRLLHPDLVDHDSFRKFWKSESQSAVPVRIRKAVRRRLLFDVIMETGLFSRIGRTLEATGSVAIGVEAGNSARLAAIARKVLTESAGQELLDADIATADDPQLVRWVRGVVKRMRDRGAIEHEWLNRYIKNDGNRYHVWGGRPKHQGMPAFPLGRATPAFPRIGPTTGVKDPTLDAVSTPQSWYTRWASRSLDVSAHFAGVLARQLFAALANEGILTATASKTGTVYALPANSIVVCPTNLDDLGAGRHLLACEVCLHQVPVTLEAHTQMDGAPCVIDRCPGHLKSSPQRNNFYRTLYESADMRRVVAREHTSLLEDETRLEYETAFKSSQNKPDAPNVLVATPTLEMGIDIGDLSTVMLASLPRTVASYLQRIGRAGRLTGNALSLAFVTGRGEHLPRLGQPLSMINGQVRPPATYLSAEEILRRQYIAYLVDAIARDPEGQHPKKATGAMAMGGEGDFQFLGTLADHAEREAETGLATFLDAFPGLDPDAAQKLRDWVAPDPAISSMIRRYLSRASMRWKDEVDSLKYQIAELENILPALNNTADLPAASDDDKAAAKTASGTLRLLRGQRKDLLGAHWIAVLEEYGILPNYTLLDDSVTLDVALTWIDPDTGKYESEAHDYQRSSANALRELAPGATFYARGWQIEVDTVDLGPEAQDVRDWALCPACGFAAETGPGQTPPGACPRCGSAAIADAKQRKKVIELSRVSAEVRRDESAISDSRDDRIRQPFSIVVAADIDPSNVENSWYIDGYDFGVKYLNPVDLRWFNTGKLGQPVNGEVAGNAAPFGGFRVCSACGHLDSAAGSNSPRDHRAWCKYRTSANENTIDVLLSRTLTTQGLVIRLPHSVTTADTYAEPSLAAALMLGLRESLGGSPDHISVAEIADPIRTDGGPAGQTARALLLHDSVPGGTGYLAGLSNPETMWTVLHTAWTLLRDCPCAAEDRLACHRCLLPFSFNRPDSVSRQVAQRHLHDILRGQSALRDNDSDDDDADDERELTKWAVTAEEPVSGSTASPLEVRFRALFIDRLNALGGVTVKELPGPEGNTLQITLTGGKRRWSFEPEVSLGYVKPDFVLRADDPNIPRVAIFTDGYQYHASPLHNIIGVDAEKRQALRDEGYIVLSLSYADLVAHETAGSYQGKNSGLAPFWLEQTDIVSQLLSAGFIFPPAAIETARTGMLGFLMAWIQQPDPVATRQIADILPWFFVPIAAPCQLDDTTPLDVLAANELLGEEQPAGTMAGWRWRDGPLVLLARAHGTEPTSPVELAVVIDDRVAAVADPEHKEAWQNWLRLANAINLRAHATTLTALSQVQLGASVPTRIPLPASDIDLSHEWKLTLELDLEDEERTVLAELQRAGLPAPTVGTEIDGIPILVSWPQDKVLLDFDLAPDEQGIARGAGWTVLPLNTEALHNALTKEK